MSGIRYQRRPAEVEAIRWTGENLSDVADLTNGSRDVAYDGSANALLVTTTEGRMRCMRGDWLVHDVGGDFYPVRDDVFAKTYEAVDAVQIV